MHENTMNGFGHTGQRWRIPMLLLALLLGSMTFVSFSTPGMSADNDTSVRLSLAILKRACEINGGQFTYTFDLNEDGSVDRIYASCSGKDGDMCTIFPDGEYFCVLTQPRLTLQQQVAQPDSTSVAVMTGDPGTGTANQSPGGAGTKVESRQPTAPTSTPIPERIEG